MPPESPSRIIALTASNFKRLKAVTITPEGDIVQVTGPNGAGKSSVLDAIQAALGGTRLAPSEPIRRGQKTAEIVLDLGDLKVERTFKAGSNPTLVVTTAEGAKLPSPQAVLDKLTGALTFDPLAFTRLDAKAQADTLRKIAGLDFTKQDAQRRQLYEDRTGINRQIKALEPRIAACPLVVAPDEEVSAADIATRLNLALQHKGRNEALRRQHADEQARQNRANDAVTRAEETLRLALAEQEAADKSVAALERTLASLSEPDVASIQAEMAKVDETNNKVRQKRERQRLRGELEQLQTQVADIESKMQAIDEAKAQAIAAANLPIPGLGIDDEGVTLDGLPFAQASSAQQLRASVAIGFAHKPQLRVMLVREGSLLDSEGMKLLGAIAAEYDAQVWVEKVTDGEPIGVVIEDGEVAA